MAMVPLRKDHAGDAAGRLENGAAWSFDWSEDGAVVPVPYEVALDLLAIPHGGFTVAEQEQADASGDSEEQAGREIEEPAPVEDELSEAPAPRKRAAKKAAVATPVEE